VNFIFLAGKVGTDAELRTLPSGKPVLNWKLVVDVGWGERATSLWIECALFGTRAEKLAPHITKGKPLSVCGTFNVRAFQTKNGPGAAVTCDVQDLELQGTRQADSRSAAAQPFDDKAAASAAFDDNIPF